MTTAAHNQHPNWCDPRTCVTDPGTSVEHRTTPTVWKPVGDDTELTVGLYRTDCTDFAAQTGPVRVTVRIESILGVADTGLTPADTRMFAAALLAEAERAEAYTRARAANHARTD